MTPLRETISRPFLRTSQLFLISAFSSLGSLLLLFIISIVGIVFAPSLGPVSGALVLGLGWAAFQLTVFSPFGLLFSIALFGYAMLGFFQNISRCPCSGRYFYSSLILMLSLLPFLIIASAGLILRSGEVDQTPIAEHINNARVIAVMITALLASLATILHFRVDGHT